MVMAGCAGGPAVAPPAGVQGPVPLQTALPGTEAIRVAPASVQVGHVFTMQDPWQVEVQLPLGAQVSGRGIFPGADKAGFIRDMVPPRVDGATHVLQLELPNHRFGEVDEQARGSGGLFDEPVFCERGAATCGTGQRGRWRAWRVREVGGVTQADELVLGPVSVSLPDAPDPSPEPRWVSVWLEDDVTPLGPDDRIRLHYVGWAPRVATDWLARGVTPRVRYLQDAGTQACPGATRCLLELRGVAAQSLELRAGPPAWLDVRAPLDAEAGQPLTLEVVVLDARGNPTPMTGDLVLGTTHGDAGPTVSLVDAWRGQADWTPPSAAHRSFTVTNPDGLSVRRNWTLIWAPGQMPHRRLLGDVHVHSGGDGTEAFLPDSYAGDHNGQFVRAGDALRYLDEVAGLDFGALSEHAAWTDGYKPPRGSDAFSPGRPCEVEPRDGGPRGTGWWIRSQASARSYDDAHPDFTVFPAFEWHGGFDTRRGGATKAHRIVLYRRHAEAPVRTLPMLPGSTSGRAPACLFRFLEDSGITPDDALVIPHMMVAQQLNQDWDVGYDPPAPFDRLVGRDVVEDFQRVGEIFSARSYARNQPTWLRAFEGGDEPAPFTFRYGWRDVGATIGVIAASDNHSQTPGLDEFWPADGSAPDVSHEPGGVAVVLTDPQASPRDGVYDGLWARRSYGTSGIRAWLGFRLGPAGAPVDMGAELDAGAACELVGRAEVMSGKLLRELSVWGAAVGHADAWVPLVQRIGPNAERLAVTFTLTNPLGPQATEPVRWAYYQRAYFGQALAPGASEAEQVRGHEDAAWSSPIWVTWHPGGGCSSP